MEERALPLGIDNFEKLRDNNFYYIDKSLLIKELIDNRSEVSLFTRPRRFGKSLNLSMLQHYFEIGKDSRAIFEGLKIMDMGEKYLSHMNRYPVIMLSLKAVDKNTFESSFLKLKDELVREFRRHIYLLKSDKIDEFSKANLKKILSEAATKEEYENSISFLSECLERHFGERVVTLIDEYDVPLEKSYFKGYYDEMIETLRSMMNATLKTNTALAFAVMMGCLRISKESIFTGLNNLRIETILSTKYGEYFGFTKQEVAASLKAYHLEHKKDLAAKWYDGYEFGNKSVYNPWSMIQYLYDAKDDEAFYPRPYWSNTSSNSIIRNLIERAGPKEKEEIENLIQGGTILAAIHEDITYEDIDSSPENLWNFLFFTGYLKKDEEKFERNILYLALSIPNEEVRYIYVRKIEEWMRDTILSQKHTELFEGMLVGDTEKFEKELNVCLKRSMSYMDNKESFYHGFLTGILDNMGDYQVKSNRESGNGRADIFVMSYFNKKIAIIIEIKVASSYQTLGKFCDKALAQIERKKYEEELNLIGYYYILKYGIAFYKKDCQVKMKNSNSFIF